ncbi:Ergot alkaloid biosynthesis protein [Rutstroemia sp. NJR-2017a BBW]|nr:Ergot alkaloid biosynthesis protein [Rutstroemia sp. NJR-2017a BBW]
MNILLAYWGQIANSERGLWFQHLQGARDIILYRGGPRTSDFLTRFFALLDISGSLWSGQGPLLPGHYWIEDAPTPSSPPKQLPDGSLVNGPVLPGPSAPSKGQLNWPYYDDGGVMTSTFHLFMIFIAKVSRLSSRAMAATTPEEEAQVRMDALEIRNEVEMWWQSCPPGLRDQRTDWRRQPRERKLTVAETLEEEAFSSTKACMHGVVMFIYHIINPLGLEPQSAEIPEAIKDVLEIAEETPEGYGLEMGLYYGLFAVGITVVNNYTIEEVVRRKLKADTRIALYNADRALELLEVLWRRQHQYNRKFDWREVQKQMDIHILQAEKKSAILLLGGTGKVSRRIAPLLCSADSTATVLLASRSGSVPQSCVGLPNSIGIHFDWLDPATYSNPFQTTYSISALFFIAPPVYDALPPAKSFLDLARAHHVPRVVFLSGSVLHAGDGPVLAQIATYIKEMGCEYTVLRASWFMENFSEMHHLWTIRDESRIVAAAGWGKVPWVAVGDVAGVARGEGGLGGREVLVLGEELWGFDEVEEEDIVRDMVAAGVEEKLASVLAGLDGVVRRGEEERLGGCLREVLGRRGKFFREYVEECVASGVWVRWE